MLRLDMRNYSIQWLWCGKKLNILAPSAFHPPVSDFITT